MSLLQKASRWGLIAGALLFMAMSCSEETAPTSGIEGLVTIQPVCPESQDSDPCQGAPFETTLVIRELQSGEEVATVQSAADGTFRVPLPPGEYIVEPPEPESFVAPFAGPQIITVHEGEFSSIEVVYDSGVR